MHDPLLLGGYKFHIRAYAIITSIQPFRGYLYRMGRVEFASRPFDLNLIGEKFVKYCHITNMCVNTEKQNMKYYRQNKPVVGVGTEWELQKLLDVLPEHVSGFTEEKFWS